MAATPSIQKGKQAKLFETISAHGTFAKSDREIE